MTHNFLEYKRKVRESIESRNEVVKLLYLDKALKAKITSYTFNYGGDKDDVHQLLVESIIRFVQRCYNDSFEINTSVEAYVLTVAKNLWIRTIKSRTQDLPLELTEIDRGEPETTIEQLLGGDRMELLRNALGYLDEKCKKVLTLWASNVKMREIALRLNYKSEGFTRKKKHACLKKLKQLIERL